MQEFSEWSSLDGAPEWALTVVVFLFGLVVGSFLNVLIHRLPRGLSVVTPGSRCPHCASPIKPHHNIPLISFVLLRGRCSSCGARISPLYPVVEITTAVLFLLVFRQSGLGWALLLDFAFVGAILALAVIDAKHRILPDAITYPGFVLAVGLRAFMPDPSWRPLPLLRYDVLVSELTPTWAAITGALGIALTGAMLLLIEWLDDRILGKRLEEAEARSAAVTDRLAEVGPVGNGSAKPEESAVSPPASDAAASSAVSEAEVGLSHPEKRAVLELMVVILAVILAVVFFVVALKRESLAAGGAVSVLNSLVGAVVGGWFLWLSRLGYYALRKLEGVGFGDIKMMLVVGAFIGWQGAFMTILLGSILGSVYGVTVMILTRQRNPKMAFGLFLGIAALATFFIQA